jgi:uncharacterized membrane protein YkgB
MIGFVALFDRWVVRHIRAISMPLARIVLFVVFFWFGFLKVVGMSPADSLVYSLLEMTLPFIEFQTFFIGLGIYEIVLGILFIVPGQERFAVALLIPHAIATFLPLFVVPDSVWSSFLVPRLEGQYIIKNIVIVALALGITAHLKPFRKRY